MGIEDRHHGDTFAGALDDMVGDLDGTSARSVVYRDWRRSMCQKYN